MRLRTALMIGAAALSAMGCESGREAPPKTLIQVVNAAPSYAGLRFLREERVLVDLAYATAGAPQSVDQDEYNFHVEMVPIDSNVPDRIASFRTEVEAGTVYTFVLTEGAGGGIEPVAVAVPEPPASAAQLVAVHAGTGLPALDLFVEPPGADLTTATPLGRLSFQQVGPPADRPPGDYVVTITEAGNPTNVLLSSGTATLSSAQRLVLVMVTDPDAGTAPLTVVIAANPPGVLTDPTLGANLRVINGAADQGARDVALGDDFAPPLFAAVPHASASSYAELPPGSQSINVTPAGNPGVIETTETVSASDGRLFTLVLAGQPGELDGIVVREDGRRIFDRARLALYNAASQFEVGLTFYALLPGMDPATATPVGLVPAPGRSTPIELPPGSYELLLMTSQEPHTAVGSIAIDVVAGGLYAVLAVNGPDVSSATFVLLEDFIAPP